MKKGILLVVITGMLGWAIFDFVDSGEDNSADEDNFEVTSETDNQEISDPDNSPDDTAKVGLNQGDIAPDFQLQTLEGEEVKLSDFRGNRVMLNFWATWCPPCRAEMPDMEKFHQDKDVVILAVNLTDTEPTIKQVKDFVNEYSLTFPILLDEVIEVANTYAVQPIPTSFMIDSNGIIQFKTFGPLNYEQMVQEFEKME